jgi:hypothetical protein
MRSNPGRGPGDWLLGVERPQSRAPVDLFGWHLVICSSPLSCAATAAVRCNSGWPRQPQPQFFEGAGPYAQLLADPSIDALIAVPNDFMDVGPEATRETLARAGCTLLSGEGVVCAIGPGRRDARARSGGCRRRLLSRHGQIDDP